MLDGLGVNAHESLLLMPTSVQNYLSIAVHMETGALLGGAGSLGAMMR